MSLKRFISAQLLKRRNLVKLFCALLLALLTTYLLAGGFSVEDSRGFANDVPMLRPRSEAIMERKMLNANEDSMESLRAPTTRASNPGMDKIIEDGVRMSEHVVVNGNHRDDLGRRDHMGRGGAAPVPANADTQMVWNQPITNKINYKKSFEDDETNREWQKQQQNMDGRIDSYNSGDRRNHNYDMDNRERVKIKQWETYDYENPNNLLQIHVDRAPEHGDGIGTPWPMPQSYLTERTFHIVDMENFRIVSPPDGCNRVNRAVDRYTRHIQSKIDLFIPDGESLRKLPERSEPLRLLRVMLSRSCQDNELPHEHMSEQYKLTISHEGAELSAQEPWGVIRGLETFSQLIYYNKGHAIINNTHIKDYPRFRFRGLMIDTARHYIPIRNIKRTMDVMSYNKLNALHWHMVDDQSFPYVSEVFPKLSKLGAYSKEQVYTPSDIRNLIDYAGDRAIRIIPEFDSPGHTRSWGLGYPKLLTNCSAEHHPFGAVNPISNYTYEFMSKFWGEVHTLFPDSTVHVGGDEINYKCWLRLKKIRDFMLENNMTVEQYDYQTLDGDRLQGYYLKHLLEVMPKDRKKIAWEEAFNAAQIWNVSMDELIINVWKGGDYEWQYTIENVIRHGYKAILSAPWYLNYISYGRDWTKYYEQDPHSFLTYSSGADMYKDYVIGGQVCMWAEFIDESNLESTLWPRASAPAEKFWSSAMMNDWRMAEVRFENHRCRMARRGVRVQPNSGPGSCKGRMRIKPPYDANPNFF